VRYNPFIERKKTHAQFACSANFEGKTLYFQPAGAPGQAPFQSRAVL
jgi:hypothetical protein